MKRSLVGSNTKPFYIQNCVVMKHLIKRLRSSSLTYAFRVNKCNKRVILCCRLIFGCFMLCQFQTGRQSGENDWAKTKLILKIQKMHIRVFIGSIKAGNPQDINWWLNRIYLLPKLVLSVLYHLFCFVVFVFCCFAWFSSVTFALFSRSSDSRFQTPGVACRRSEEFWPI